jgi:hypothetical protein
VLSVANLTRQDGIDFPAALAAQIPLSGPRPRAIRYEQANQALDDLRAGRFEGAAVLIHRLKALRSASHSGWGRTSGGGGARKETRFGHQTRHAVTELLLQPAGGLDQGRQGHARAHAAALEQVDQIFGGDIAGGRRRERAAADAPDARIERARTPASSAAQALAMPVLRVL